MNVETILLNWKTTAAGASAVLLALGDMLHTMATGTVDPTALWSDLMALIAGVGLIVAKDGK